MGGVPVGARPAWLGRASTSHPLCRAGSGRPPRPTDRQGLSRPGRATRMRPHQWHHISAADARSLETDIRERIPALGRGRRGQAGGPMTDLVRDRILAEALIDIPQTGFSQETLANAASRAGISRREVNDAFPNGPADLVEAFSHWADRQMTDKLAVEPEEAHLRDRIAAAVRARIEALNPHKEATRRAAAFLALPHNAPLGAKLMMRSVDAMWR